MLKRIFLFVASNIAILLVLSIVMEVASRVFGINLSGNSYAGMMVVSLVMGFGGAFISLAISRWIAKKTYNIVLIDEKNIHQASVKEQAVYTLVSELATRNGIKMPEVWIYVDTDPNAFATGRSKNASLVAVSTWLLEVSTQAEIDGVVAHEMAHILNGDMVTMALLQWILNTFVIFFSKIIARAIDEATDGKLGWLGYQIVYMLLQILLWLWASLILMKFSRYREYRADLWSAQYVWKQKMIAALKRLQIITATHAVVEDERLGAFKISGGNKTSWFASHPSLESRIAALEADHTLA